MADQLQIQITGDAKVALAALNEAASAIVKLQATATASNTAAVTGAKQHETALQNLWLAFRTAPSAGAMLKDVGVIASGVAGAVGRDLVQGAERGAAALGTALATGAKNALNMLKDLGASVGQVVGNLVQSLGPLLGISIGVGVGIMIEQAVSKTIAWDDAIAVLSRDLQFNTVVASTWAARASFIGIQADQLKSAFTRLSVSITTHSADLASMGVAVVDSNGKLRSTADILSDLSTWFQKYAGSAIAADQATKIFGRGNADMAALLGMTKEQMAALDAEANRLGLIIGTDQLNKWRAFDAEVKASGDVVQGLELALGHALMPAFAIIGSAITDFITNNLAPLTAWLAKAVTFVVAFIAELTGQNFVFSDFAAAISQISTQVSQLGTIQDLSGASTQSAADATRDQTEAITNQIDALRQANQLLQEQTDSQIALLQAQGQADAFTNKKTQQTQKIADDQKNIDKLRSQYQQYLLIGDLTNAQNVDDQIVAAQQQMTNDQMTLATDEADRERQLKIKGLQDAQKANTDQTNDLITALQNRARAIQQSANASNAGLLAGAQSTAGGVTSAFQKAGDDLVTGLDSSSAQAAKDLADNIKTAMAQIEVMIDPSSDPKKAAARQAAWNNLGQQLGKALLEGIGSALAQDLTDFFAPRVQGDFKRKLLDALFGRQIGDQLFDWIFGNGGGGGNHGDAGGSGGFSFAGGGFIGGSAQAAGRPRLMIGHPGELVLNAAQQHNVALAIAGPSSGGPVSVVQHIYGQSDPEATAAVVMQKLRFAMGRK